AEEQPDLSIYVVTGGAGFIGSQLTTRIGQAGHEVRVLDSLTAAASRARVEALAQVAGVLAYATLRKVPNENTRFYFAGIDSCRFRRPQPWRSRAAPRSRCPSRRK
ncbi:NAD-dependent epimerase/dehydratase family protein, partial [Lacticaseibacillus rhamnosus]